MPAFTTEPNLRKHVTFLLALMAEETTNVLECVPAYTFGVTHVRCVSSHFMQRHWHLSNQPKLLHKKLLNCMPALTAWLIYSWGRALFGGGSTGGFGTNRF